MEIIKTSEPFKIGSLQIPPQGFLKAKKSWPKKFYALYEASDDGVQRLEVFDNEENYYRKSSNKIIPLTDCVKVTTVVQKHQNNLFEVVTKNQTYLFSAESHQDMNDWVSAFRSVAFGSSNTLKSLPSSFNSTESNLSSSSSTINEENMIYSSVDAPEVYVIKVGECDAKKKLNLNSTYHLLITSVGISLTEIGVPIHKSPFTLTWAYRHIRRYGYSHDTFSFEAGRKSMSGEGLFIFETKDGAAIFQSTASHVNLLKSSRCENPSPSEENKAFFSSGQTSPKKSDSPTTLSREKITSQDFSKLKPLPPAIKPPRKQPKPTTSDSSLESEHTYEDPGSMKGRKKSSSSAVGVEFVYDYPEERSDAWKTLGREVDDTYESDSNDPGYECVTVTRRCKEMEKKDDPLKSPSITNDNSGHTYAKVKMRNKDSISSRKSSLQSLSEPNGESQESAECSSPYQNVRLDKQPAHFLFNDSEYAQVIRRKT